MGVAAGTDRQARERSAARRRAATICGWCGGPIVPKGRGRIPSWCSPACRQRAWEQSRAAACGLAAVRVVERHVEVPASPPPARGREWWAAPGPTGEQDPPAASGRVAQLRSLAEDLDRGRVYDRDLDDLAQALERVLDAFGRRTATGR